MLPGEVISFRLRPIHISYLTSHIPEDGDELDLSLYLSSSPDGRSKEEREFEGDEIEMG
jgi:hypothetical protein